MTNMPVAAEKDRLVIAWVIAQKRNNYEIC